MNSKMTICVIMADMTEDYRDEYIVGIEKQANRANCRTVVFSMPLMAEVHTNNEESVFSLIDFNRYDGVVFFEKSFAAHKSLGKMIEKHIYEKCGKPVVVIGKSDIYENVFSENNRSSFEALTDHIIEDHGCEVVYFLGGHAGYETERDAGFIESMKKHGLSCTEDNLIYGGFWQECAEKLARDIAYSNVEIPDAVMCYDDSIASFFITSLAGYGIRVPEDIIVSGFGARNKINNIISVTTCPCDSEYIGRKAVSKLCSLITGEEEHSISRPKTSILTGMSCGCGNNKPIDTRLKLELFEKRRKEEMYYHNSGLEEMLYACENTADFSKVISNTDYLIPDKSFFAVCLKKDENTSECIYMTDLVREGNFTEFPSEEICPLSLSYTSIPENSHVLPLIFDGILYGHAVTGYNDPLVYNFLLKRYLSRLSVAVHLIKNKKYRDMQDYSDALIGGQSEDSANHNFVFVVKSDTMHRVPVENILAFESEGRKTVAVLKSGRYEIRKTLIVLEEMLSGCGFMRVSKSALINLSKVTSVAPGPDRTFKVILGGKAAVKVSRKFVTDFKERIGVD
ncbi:MAG: LytTR family transcriptional regulator DNA-binding domain-containing protein [Ruminiclostridium sp.]|nr:LytTR family transcriptional regulator DNA-binding domain-containing protein [Ruminiclostridium sp.]